MVELDPIAAAVVDLARVAAVEVARDSAGSVGDDLGAQAEAPHIVTHNFAALVAGYTGWNWAVTVVRVADSDAVTVDEVVLLPGPDALLAPPWVPWSERMRPGDLSPGDLVPPRPNDPRLVPAYVEFDPPGAADGDTYATWDDWQVDQVADELGFGRVHVLSLVGRIDAAERWQAGPGGPDTEMARLAPAHCGTCGFYLRLAGSLQAAFGVCGNELALADGRVVNVEHGCGAHSEAMPEMSDAIQDDPLPVTFDDADPLGDIEPIE
jgi:Protein of unknown function (DUF3027)